MHGDQHRIYWDSCVFLAYFNDEEGRADIVSALLEDVHGNDDHIIVTSYVTKVEVALARSEYDQRALDPAVEQALDALWNDSSVTMFVELTDYVALRARRIMRQALQRGLSVPRGADAIHLASAQFANAVEMHTYDKDLESFSDLIDCRVCAPWLLQGRLPQF